MSRTSYVRPDIVYRGGFWRPEGYGINPVQEAYDIARDFTRDPSIVNRQYVGAATSPTVEVVPGAGTSIRPDQGGPKATFIPAFIRRFFGGR